MVIDPTIIAAILAIFGIGVVGIVQTLKRLLHLEGVGAIVLTGIVSFAATAIYLFQVSAFNVWAFLLYGILVFGEASGLYAAFKTT